MRGGEKMKPQFTEEEARDFLIDSGIIPSSIEYGIADLRRNNRIRKSDLEILIEECKGRYSRYDPRWGLCEAQQIMIKQNECIQAMKTELNKRRDI